MVAALGALSPLSPRRRGEGRVRGGTGDGLNPRAPKGERDAHNAGRRRNNMRFSLSLALVAALALSNAVSGAEYDKVLVPLPLIETPGAFGSLWKTRVTISNLGDTSVDVQGYGECGVPCTPAAIPPRGTVNVSNMPRSDVPAAFLFVEKGRRDDLSIMVRVFDQSREHLTWGATVPVITRRELFAGPFGIGDVPAGEEFRSTLRLYDFDAATPARVRVRIFRISGLGPTVPEPATPDELLTELEPAFTTPVQGGGIAGHPGYAAVPLWLLPQVAGAGRVRIVVEPLDSTGDYWAFVSTTHNATQHVTVLPPR